MKQLTKNTEFKSLTNCMATKSWLTYLKNHGHSTDNLFLNVGYDEDFLMDDSNWIPSDKLFLLARNISAKFSNEKEIFRNIAIWSVKHKVSKGLWAIFGSFLSPEKLYKSLPKRIERFNRHRKCEVTDIKKNVAVIKFKHMTNLEPYKEICEWTGGLLEAAPLTLGYPLAKVKETSCEIDGDEYCTYKVEWKTKQNIIKDIKRAIFHKRYLFEKQVEALEENHERLLERYEELSEREEKYRILIETIRDIVYTVDREGLFTYLSPMAEIITGYSQSELIGQMFEDVLLPIHREVARKNFEENFKAETVSSYQVSIISKEGKEIPLEINTTMLFDAQGQPIGRIGVARDITRRTQEDKKRKEMEIKALAQDKLASLGEIATGVAHEVNQPLSYIKIILESTLNDLSNNQLDTTELNEDFQESLRQIGKITNIISHLRSFGRSDVASFNSVRLPGVLENTMILMQEMLRTKNISINKQIVDNLPRIYGNSVKMEQVFINLLQNSMDALEEQGKGEIDLVMDQEDDEVVIRFSDNGKGIPSEVLEKVFEPFYTTKEVDQGTGIGLAIVYGIIQEHKGSIFCASEMGQGTTFTIKLPIYKEKLPAFASEFSDA